MASQVYRPDGNRHHVVIVGAGFGGVNAAKELADADVDITLINNTNHHLFPPLLYQVATGLMSSGEITGDVRQMFADQQNIRVVRGNVESADVEAKTVTSVEGGKESTFAYDSLIIAAGAGQSYFGNDHFAEFAPGMKTVEDALYLRSLIFDSFDRAETAAAEGTRRRARGPRPGGDPL